MSRVIITMITSLKLTGHSSDAMAFVGALRLIPYVFDELGAVGIAVSSSYGSGCDASKSIAIISLEMGAYAPAFRVHR
jgi:hypothetical protein